MRESDGPVDLGYYACGCGYEFAAPVATSVRCPHCGSEQAW
jgi:predicted Zn-ribbon and HTH transcriptional regulator